MAKRYELRDNPLTRNWEVWDTQHVIHTSGGELPRFRARLAIVFNEETGELIRDLLEDHHEATANS